MRDRVVAVIPARLAASRFPGKLLADLGGRPVLAHVIERVRGASRLDRVLVAADDESIAAVARSSGVDAVLTDPALPSGSDRVAAAAEQVGEERSVLVNVQGDEPFLASEAIDACVARLDADPDADVATLATRGSAAAVADPSVVTVACGESGRAVYFSRSPVPWSGDANASYLAHVGIYAYRPGVLARFVAAGSSELERRERLEQLRGLELGLTYTVAVTDHDGLAIDTPADLERAKVRLARERERASTGRRN